MTDKTLTRADLTDALHEQVPQRDVLAFLGGVPVVACGGDTSLMGGGEGEGAASAGAGAPSSASVAARAKGFMAILAA